MAQGLLPIDSQHSYILAEYFSQSEPLKGRQRILADSSSPLHANRSSLRGFRVVVDTALEIVKAELSNTASTATWKPRNGKCLTFKNVQELQKTYIHLQDFVVDP